MKKGAKLTLILSLVLLIMIVSFIIYVNGTKKVTINEMTFKPQVSPNTLMSRADMKEDLDYLVKILKDVHPKTLHGLSLEQENIVKNTYEKIEKPLKAGEFYFIANEIACSFKDAHTSLHLNENNNDKTIELPKAWLNDGMYINENLGELKEGDKVESIGGKTPEELLKEFTKIISAENQQWVRVQGNSNLIKEPYLNYLGLIKDDKVNVKILRDGKLIDIELPLTDEKYSKARLLEKNSMEGEWVKYTIDKENGLGIFILNQCLYSDYYKYVLNNFFEDVQNNKIDNIVIDLRKNTGGDSRVIGEFLKYLDIDRYKRYGVEVRFSEEVKKQRGITFIFKYVKNRSRKIKNPKVNDAELLFGGNVFILTSPITFSAANSFAVIFKDNGMGTIIGEPTGNQPSSYGDILTFQMPNSGFLFTVSYKKFIRPDISKDDEKTLNPHITVYTTIDDILKGRDPQMEKVLEIIKNNGTISK